MTLRSLVTGTTNTIIGSEIFIPLISAHWCPHLRLLGILSIGLAITTTKSFKLKKMLIKEIEIESVIRSKNV